MAKKAVFVLSCGQEVAPDATFDDLEGILLQPDAPNVLSQGDYDYLLERMMKLAKSVREWKLIYWSADDGSKEEKKARRKLREMGTELGDGDSGAEKKEKEEKGPFKTILPGGNGNAFDQALEALLEQEFGSLEWELASRKLLGAARTRIQLQAAQKMIEEAVLILPSPQ